MYKSENQNVLRRCIVYINYFLVYNASKDATIENQSFQCRTINKEKVDLEGKTTVTKISSYHFYFLCEAVF